MAANIKTYRGDLLIKEDGVIKNFDTDAEHKSFDEAMNAIDKRLGGYAGPHAPKRWIKDPELAKQYNGPYPIG